MNKYYIIYNPLAGGNTAYEKALSLRDELKAEGIADMTKITNYEAFLSDKTDCNIVVCGGDGTLNRFANDISHINFPNDIYCCASGTGNDFYREFECNEKMLCITQYLRNLPVCHVNGTVRHFINGIGYGIDGYCCEVGDKLRSLSKPVNYGKIAIKGLIYAFKPVSATVTVDGKKYEFSNVWIAPTMHGKYYGGGMIPTPEQSRNDPENMLSVCIFHCKSRLKTLIMFPSIFKGEHIKYKKNVTVLKGKCINVKFSRSCSLQIDGETYLNVNEYDAYGNGCAEYKTAIVNKNRIFTK